MIREALNNINERRVKTQSTNDLRHALHKQVMQYVKKNVKKWHKESFNTNDWSLVSKEFPDVKELYSYIDGEMQRAMQTIIFENSKNNKDENAPTTQLVIRMDEELIRTYLGYYEFTEWIFDDFMYHFDYESFAKKRGYYISGDASQGPQINILLHANYDMPMATGRFVYHVSSLHWMEDNLKNGLKPRSGDKMTHDLPRVYVALTVDDAIGIFDAFFNWERYSKGVDPTSRIIYKIDTKKLRKGTKFYSDEDFKTQGAWTYTHIPAKALEFIPPADWDEEEYQRQLQQPMPY